MRAMLIVVQHLSPNFKSVMKELLERRTRITLTKCCCKIYLQNKNTHIREELMVEQKVNCAEACVNGCVLGDQCPNIEYRESASKFIEETSLDKMLEIAEERLRKKMTEPPKWVFPEDS
jgi:hypothetical protein